MRHNHLGNGDHWAVGWTGETLPGTSPSVLVQVQEKGDQARVALSPEQAEAMAEELRIFAAKARTEKRLPLP